MWAVIFFANWYYYNWFVCLLIFLLNVRCNIREVSLFHVLVLRHLQFLFFFLSFCFLSGSHQFKPNYTTDLFLCPLKKENQICVSGAIEWEQIYVQIKGLKKKKKKNGFLTFLPYFIVECDQHICLSCYCFSVKTL